MNRNKSERNESERNKSEQGVALVAVMTATALLTALVGSLTLAVMTDTMIAANYRDAATARYAAEAAVEYVLPELAAAENWSNLVEGRRSAVVDRPPVEWPAPVADAVLHRSGWFRDLLPGSGADSGLYVSIWIADRLPSPGVDGAVVEQLAVVGEAFGARGTRRAVEAIVERGDTSAVRLVAWRELP